jgi:hypothetical protein
MQKIATPQELQTGLLSILAYVQGTEKPEREKVASDLRELADRVAARSTTPVFIHTKYEKGGKTHTVKDAWPPSFGKPSNASLTKAVKGREKSRPDEKVIEAEVKTVSGKSLARYKVATDVTAAKVPRNLGRLIRMTRNEGHEVKKHEVWVKFKSESDANRFEDRYNARFDAGDGVIDEDDEDLMAYGSMDPKTGMYTIKVPLD